MNPLYIYFQGENMIPLTGENDTVIQGCRYAPGSGKVSLGEPPFVPRTPAARRCETAGEVIEETLDLILEGTADVIDARLFKVEKYLEMANQETVQRDWVYLRFYDGTSYDWRSRIVGGRIEYLNHGLIDRDNESQWARLHIKRLNYWAGSRRLCPCFTATMMMDPSITEYIPNVYGHCDAEHKNYFGIEGHACENDLPTPIELDFQNIYSADQFYNLTISARVLRGTSRAEAGYVEGETLAQGSVVVRTIATDPACSGGSYGSFAWTSAGDIQLATWSPSSADLAILRGQTQRGLMRLQAALACSDLWICLKILVPNSAVVLAESLWMLTPSGSKYIELPPIAIPPGLAGYDLFQSVTVGIYARKADGAAAALPIDFIQFVPAESIRRLTYLNNPQTMGLNSMLVDSGSEEETYFLNDDGTKAITHIGSGNFPVLYPGYDSIIHVNHREDGDATYRIDARCKVVPYYEPRRRNL